MCLLITGGAGDWYLNNQDLLKSVTSGDYTKYYNK